MRKQYSRIISIMLAMVMVLTSLSIVFAADEVPAGEVPADEVATDELAEDYQDGDQINTNEEPSENPAPADDYETVDPTLEMANPERKMLLGNSAEPAAVTITIYYVFEDGSEAAPTITENLEFGTNYSYPSPTIIGYKADQKTVAGKVESEDPIKVTVKYFPSATAAVTDLKLHPSYNSIILTWKKVDGAKKYIIRRSTDNKNFSNYAEVADNGAANFRWKDYKANGTEGKFKKARTYYYRVFSVSRTDLLSAPVAVSGTCVRPMYEAVTFKKKATLKSHDGKNKKVTFYKGQTITAQGFGGGKYRFWYNGNYFYVSYIRVKKCQADYMGNAIAKSKNYSGIWAAQKYASGDATGAKNNFSGIRCYDKISAEDFVNSSGKGSSTKYLIWVSTYQQHLYVFQGKKGAWKLIKDWECATGAAKSPTPTGFDKKLQKKTFKSRHGIKWWKTFQTMNSIHGKKKNWTMGGPASNGCVRNFDGNAKWVYDNCAKGTGLIVY